MKKTFFILIFCLTSTSVFAFSDVDESEIYQTGIEFLNTEGIVNGYGDGTFRPQQTLNRAELLKIIAIGAQRYYGWDASVFDTYGNQKCFNDVPANEWFTKYVCYFKDKGWVQGYENGLLFKPSQTVTFVEGLKITFRGFDIVYDENDSIWYRKMVERASQDNFIPHTIRDFHAGLRRDQMADLITRIIKKQQDKLDEYLGDRTGIIVNYDSIEANHDLTKLEREVICAEGENCKAE